MGFDKFIKMLMGGAPEGFRIIDFGGLEGPEGPRIIDFGSLEGPEGPRIIDFEGLEGPRCHRGHPSKF